MNPRVTELFHAGLDKATSGVVMQIHDPARQAVEIARSLGEDVPSLVMSVRWINNTENHKNNLPRVSVFGPLSLVADPRSYAHCWALRSFALYVAPMLWPYVPSFWWSRCSQALSVARAYLAGTLDHAELEREYEEFYELIEANTPEDLQGTVNPMDAFAYCCHPNDYDVDYAGAVAFTLLECTPGRGHIRHQALLDDLELRLRSLLLSVEAGEAIRPRDWAGVS